MRFETSAKRAALLPGLYWETLTRGLALGYRKGLRISTWWRREYIGKNRVRKESFATVADNALEADGEHILNHAQAAQATFGWSTRSVQKSLRTLTVGNVVDAYLRHYEINSSDDTLSNSVIAKRWIGNDLRSMLVADLRTYDLERWRDDLVLTGEMERSSANRVWTVLRAALNYGHQKMGVADKDRWTRIKPFGRTNKPKGEYLTVDEAIKLTRAMPADFRAISLGSLYTGGRYGELSKMEVQHVDLTRAQVEFVFTKSGKRREVPLTPAGVEHFRGLVEGRKAGQPVFIKADGKPWGKGHQIRRMMKASKDAGFPRDVNFHQFRHTYASLLAQNGISMRSLQELLGHSDQRITVQHYAHVCPQRIADEVIEHLPSFSDTDKTSMELGL